MSTFTISIILLQLQEGHQYPIAFLSRKLYRVELYYNTPNIELIAIVEAFYIQRLYLAYTQDSVQVLTDHLNYYYLTTKLKLLQRQVQQIEEILVFDFKIKYREDKKNPIDRLSYRLDLQVSSKVLEARKALLISFLRRFTSIPQKEVQVIVVVRLL